MQQRFRSLDFNPYSLPKEYVEAIGLACANYAQTEDCLQMAIWGLLDIDGEMGWALTTHMAFPLRESVIKSLSELKFDDLKDIENLDQILSDIKDAADKRNKLSHHMWCVDEKTHEVFRIETSARTRVSVEQKPVSLKEIRDDAEFIYTAGLKLLQFLKAKSLIPKLPPRDRPRFDKRKAIKKARTK